MRCPDILQPLAIALGASKRSGRWPRLSRQQLKNHPDCVCCGKKADLTHHVIPFSNAPDREEDPTNFASMCRKCHFTIGHMRMWQDYNGNFWQTVRSMERKT